MNWGESLNDEPSRRALSSRKGYAQGVLTRVAAGVLRCLFGGVVASQLLACGQGPSVPAEEQVSFASDEIGAGRFALANAELDPEHTGVVAIVTSDPERVALCTGTLLAPNLVLTARHCVAPSPSSVDTCEVARFGQTFRPGSNGVNKVGGLNLPLPFYVNLDNAEFELAAQVYVPPAAQTVCDGDLALLVLEESLSLADHAPIAPRLDEPVLSAEPYAAVGYGNTPDVLQSGQRRIRSSLSVTCAPGECPASVRRGAADFVGGEGVCVGDSGGPALAADGRVFAVASRSDNCGPTVYVSLAPFRDWIRQVAVLAAEAGQFDDLDWFVEPEISEEPDAGTSTPAPKIDAPASASDASPISSPSEASDQGPQPPRPERGCALATAYGGGRGGHGTVGATALLLFLVGFRRFRLRLLRAGIFGS